MKAIARTAISSLVVLSTTLILVISVIAVIGALGARSSTQRANAIAQDELATSTVTSLLGHDIVTAYTTGEQACLASRQAVRSRLFGSLYSSQLPDIDSDFDTLGDLHEDDPPAERADYQRFVGQWLRLRNLFSPANVSATALAALAARMTAAYQPVSQHIERLIQIERADGQAGEQRAAAAATRTTIAVIVVAVIGILAGLALLFAAISRVRRNMKPGQDQAEFGDTLQIAGDEEEAHRLLQRHLERSLPGSAAVVLNRNNSADRLEAVTPLPAGSPLSGTLRGAGPRSCLAVRSGRPHCEEEGRSALLACPVCARCPGTSSCVPLTVGGEVIGSVLLSRPHQFTEAEQAQIRESVGQAAPVLANLRNLAVAEIRAATDSLTGLPNKRAVTDALKRMYAQALTAGAPLSLLLIDLDHFKHINDEHGHPVGDQVLANVGASLRGALRAWDFAGRGGGEEFTVLLPGADLTAALEVAERVRAAIAEVTVAGTEASVTASIGVAVFPEHASTADRLERLADAALYLAKRHGRNRVEVAEPGAGAEPAAAGAGLPAPADVA